MAQEETRQEGTERTHLAKEDPTPVIVPYIAAALCVALIVLQVVSPASH